MHKNHTSLISVPTALTALLVPSLVLAQAPAAEAPAAQPPATAQPPAVQPPAVQPPAAQPAPSTPPPQAEPTPTAPPAASAAEPSPPVAPPPAAEPASAEPAAAPVELTSEAAAPPVEPEEEEAAVPASYFRIDHDYLFGLQLWAGATYDLADSVGLATDIYIAENYPSGDVDGLSLLSWWGEFDLGPTFSLGPVSLTPMVGIGFDWAAKKAVAINGPQLYTIIGAGDIYFESWIWTILYSAFDKDGANDYFHTRDWLLYQLSDTIGIGPQVEFTYDLEAKETMNLPLGGHVELAYGSGNSLGLFLGYEMRKAVRDAADGAAAEGRLTFVHNF